MDHKQPSMTALRVARLRARHQISSFASVFVDPYAIPLLGEGEPLAADLAAEDVFTNRLRLFVVARSRFAEDSLAAAVKRGVRQVVVLGAGLDTLSLRNPHRTTGLRIFEVDHPATQAWKRQMLVAAAIAEPEATVFVPVDFERQRLPEELSLHGYHMDEPGFFIWLGVVPYLTREAIFSTLSFIAAVPGSEVVFDYGEPPESREEPARTMLLERARKLAEKGEPWISFFDPDALAADLEKTGFDEIEDLSGSQLGIRYFDAPPGTKNNAGAHVLRARRTA
ncbi:MAG TPA: SAM-dependent methyltransferase [Rhizobiaceae bacterium]|nr:SAM-dependent methyltransferase [Rhizobiaceae bacterium]